MCTRSGNNNWGGVQSNDITPKSGPLASEFHLDFKVSFLYDDQQCTETDAGEAWDVPT